MANLLRASHKTLLQGRRFRGEGAWFKFNLEKNLTRLHEQLLNKTYKHGKYTEFKIFDPKERLVLAAPIKDRVVHHAVNDILEPIIDRKFIYDTYACRKNKGTHKAIRRTQCFLNACNYSLHLDVRKYFPSIDLRILKKLLYRYLDDQECLWLLNVIIDSSKPLYDQNNSTDQLDLFSNAKQDAPVNKGLPIGNLTSQFFANLYLNELDQFVKHKLKIRYYLRYMDDMVIFSSDKSVLKTVEHHIRGFCEKKLKLEIKPTEGPVFYKRGVSFLGFRIFRAHLRLKSQNIKRFYKRFDTNLNHCFTANKSWEYLQESVDSWMRFAAYGDTYHLRNRITEKINMLKYNKLETLMTSNS